MSPTRRSSKRLKASTEKVIEEITTKINTTTSPKRKTKSPPQSEKTKEKIATKTAWNELFKTKSSTSSSTTTSSFVVRTNKKNDGQGLTKIDSKIQEAIDNHPRFSQISEKTNTKNHKIIAWNVNGLRACLKKEDGIYFKAYVAQENPDIFCISETKICQEELAKVIV
jgi:hypothetical protein